MARFWVVSALTVLFSMQAVAAPLVEWTSEESLARFARSAHKVDFFSLSNHFVSQDNKIYCGPASSAIVLNALRLGKREGLPQDRRAIAAADMSWLPAGFDPFLGKYTPNNVLIEGTKTVAEVLGKPIEIEGELKKDFGLQLRQLAHLLRAHGLSVTTRVVDEDAAAAALIGELVRNLGTRDDYVLVNYPARRSDRPGAGISRRSPLMTREAIPSLSWM